MTTSLISHSLRIRFRAAAFATAILILTPAAGAADDPKVGELAPEFGLQTHKLQVGAPGR